MGSVTASANPPTPGAKFRIKVGQTIAGFVWSNVAFTVSGEWTIIYDDGSPDFWPVSQIASGSSRASVLWTTNQIAKKNGWVVGGQVGSPSLPAQRGQAYFMCNIIDANLNLTTDTIAKGYAYAGHPVEFGTFVEPGPAGGQGCLLNLTTADPAAAAEIADQVVPAGAIWLLRLFTVQIVQGITQTPLPALEFETTAGVQAALIPAMTTALGASTTALLTWAIGLVQESFVTVVGDEMYTAPLPLFYFSAVSPLPGITSVIDRFATFTDGIGANTNYGPALYQVEEWVMPN